MKANKIKVGLLWFEADLVKQLLISGTVTGIQTYYTPNESFQFSVSAYIFVNIEHTLFFRKVDFNHFFHFFFGQGSLAYNCILDIEILLSNKKIKKKHIFQFLS